MSNKKKVVCPKCQAKLKFDPDKVTADVVKFKCPSCNTVLRTKKPTPGPTTEPFIRHERKPAASDLDQETRITSYNVCYTKLLRPIDEVDAPLVKVDMDARVIMDAFRDKNFPARVRRIDPYVLDLEKQARTVDIESYNFV